MATIISNNLLVNGLKNEFADTYMATRITQADSRIGMIMDLTQTATNREHDYAYLNAAPHMEYWRRRETIPTDAMDSVQFRVPIFEFAIRVPWSKFDRKDDQTGSLFDAARMAGTSAALLPERFLFDLIESTTLTLPVSVNASDGSALYSSSSRFGVGGGNQITATGTSAVSDILRDYYLVLNRFRDFQDGKGQPLLAGDVIDQGVVIVHPLELTEVMELAFLQRQQAIALDATGIIAGASDTGIGTGGASNIVLDSNKAVTLWGSPRLTDTTDWYVFLKGAPQKPIFYVTREGVQEFSSLEGDNNGDHTRDTGEEYVQWEERSGAGIGLPYGTVKVNT